jgi:hypothetical protein
MPSFREAGGAGGDLGGGGLRRGRRGASARQSRSGSFRSPSASQALVDIAEGMEKMGAEQAQQRVEQAAVNAAVSNALTTFASTLKEMKAVHVASVQAVPAAAAEVKHDTAGHGVLQDRGPAPTGPVKRLVGGKQRLGHRLDTLGGELEDDEFLRMSETVTLGVKVPPRARARLLRGTQSHNGSRITDMLMDAGLMELGGGHGARIFAQEDLLDSVGTVLTEKQRVRKGAAAKPFASFNKLFLKYSEVGFFSRDLFESDPGSYWSIDWHFKCVTWMDRKYGWRVAGEYHERVMARWNRFDHAERASSLDALAGDWEQACNRDILMSVLVDPDVQSAPRARSAAGTLEKVNDDDTWCSFHKRWFPKSANHNSHSCRMNGEGKTKGKKDENKDRDKI